VVYYDAQVLTNQVVYGVIGNWVIGFLKRTAWVPFINANSAKLTRAMTIGIAFVSALGIEYTYSYTLDGHFLLDLGGLTFASLSGHAYQFLVSYIFQQIPYHAMKVRDASAMASVTDRTGTTTVSASTQTTHTSDQPKQP